MISTLEKEITFRFLKTRKKDGFLNVISIFSFIGISLGVAVLIIVMSVMNGFRTELINKIVGFNAHITVKPYENKINVDEINQNLKNISKELILSNSGESIIVRENISKGILLRGYENNDFSKLKIFDNENSINTIIFGSISSLLDYTKKNQILNISFDVINLFFIGSNIRTPFLYNCIKSLSDETMVTLAPFFNIFST